MEQRQLGNEGPMIPVIGFGAWPIGGGMGAVAESEAIATIHAAIENGITLIDTAQAYRTSETVTGKALADGRRQRVFLATKVSGHYSRSAILSALENSLRELRTDYVDLYQVHWWNPQYPIEQTMSTLDALRKEGKIRFLGVSNFSASQMEEALRVAPFHSLQPRYNLLDRSIESEILPFCEREGVGILAHSPLAKGLLTGKYRSGYRFPDDDERSQMKPFQEESLRQLEPLLDGLTEIGRPRGKTLIQLAINALLRRSGVTCVLVGAKNPAQIEEHVGAQGWTLTDDEWTRIEHLLAS